MDFIEVEHSALGRTYVPASRVQHLAEGWAVVEGDQPRQTKTGDNLRITRKTNTAPVNPEALAAGTTTTEE